MVDSYGQLKVDVIYWDDNLAPYVVRKLYTVNTGHAVAAYYGHTRGKAMIHDALADPKIHEEYANKINTHISNPALKDVVEHVGRAPLRKLGRNEQLIGPAHELAEQGDKHTRLLGAIEQAFRFTNVEGDDESVELGKLLRDEDAETIVGKVCGL